MPHRGPTRPFTARQNDIAEYIRQGLSYADIGARLAPRVSAHTVRSYVRDMALLFDAYYELQEQCPPRQIVLVYAVYRDLARSAVTAAAKAQPKPAAA